MRGRAAHGQRVTLPAVQTDVQRRAAENWFRRRGLPLVVRGRLRGAALLQRTIPAIVVLLALDPLLSVLARLVGVGDGTGTDPAEVQRRLTDTGYAALALVLTAAAVVIPVLLGWLALRWQRILGPRWQHRLTAAAFGLYLLVLPLIEHLNDLRGGFLSGVAINLGIALLLIGSVYAGAGSILGWALRGALRQVGAVGTLASRALPLLLLFVLFAFFAGELWQAADRLGRGQLWVVVAFFAALCGLFIGATLADELREIGERRRAADIAELLPMLRGTPLAGAAERARPGGDHPLSAAERVNVALVLFFAQALQIATFCLLVFAFFLVFGTLAVTDEVQQAWAGAPPEPGYLFGVRLPASNALVQVSIFLAVFSGLYFAASTATDPHYRKAFFEPLLADVAVSMAAREVYLQRWADEAEPEPEAA